MGDDADELLRSEERLRQAVRVADLGIFDNDLAHRSIHWSARMRQIFGMRPDETITMDKLLGRVHPDDRGLVHEALARAEASTSDGRYDVDCRLLLDDGTARYVSVRGQTFFEGVGEERRAVRRVGACRDLTDERRAADERERLRVQLEHAQRLESVGRLAGGVAHDFNNMLVVILGAADVMRERADLPADLVPLLADIEEAASRAREITSQLLTVSRRQVVSPRVLDLNEAVTRTQKALGRLIREDVVFELHLAPDLWRISLDALQVDQVLTNLALNARDAMPDGGRLIVETSNATLDDSFCRLHPGLRPGEHVVLAVSDSGVGMDAETASHVFEPFFTTKAPGRGTGLGLATVYGIVHQAGGFVGVYSEPGKGTTFRLYLPRHRGGSDRVEPPAPRAVAIEPGCTILLVEDDERVRRTAATMLTTLGLCVLSTSGPLEALAVAADGARRIDLALSDVVMPDMNGKALREQLHALRPGLPVLFMSGYTPNVVVHRGVPDEGVRLLQKPFTLRELGVAVREALAERPRSG